MTLADTYPIRRVCRLLGVQRSSVYYTPRPATDEAMLKTALLDLAGELPTYGYRRLTAMMKRLGWSMNAKRFRRWMDELGLAGTAPVRKTRTTDSEHAFPRYPNLVKDLNVQRPDEIWVADITYIRLRDEFIYLAVLMDVFTRSIRGWHLGRDLEQGLTLAALERALVVAVPKLHHSDQGVQYAATAYVDRLKNLGVRLSMAEVGEPRENGFAERLVRTIKEEEVDLSEYRDFGDARNQLGHFIDAVYNDKRIHSSLGYSRPRSSRSNGDSCQRGLQQRRPERRIGQRWEPSQAPTQGPRLIGAIPQRRDCLSSIGFGRNATNASGLLRSPRHGPEYHKRPLCLIQFYGPGSTFRATVTLICVVARRKELGKMEILPAQFQLNRGDSDSPRYSDALLPKRVFARTGSGFADSPGFDRSCFDAEQTNSRNRYRRCRSLLERRKGNVRFDSMPATWNWN